MIEITGLKIRYPGREILIPQDIVIPEKGCFLISGDNGCGKSSLARAVVNIGVEYDGRITIDGRDNRSMSRIETAQKVSYLPQISMSEPDIAVRDFILQGLYAYGEPKAARTLLQNVTESLGIAGFLGRQYTELSGGEKQLCRIARAMIAPSGYVFLDEGDAFLSRKNRALFYAYTEKVSAERSVILITHAPAEVPDSYKTLLEMYES